MTLTDGRVVDLDGCDVCARPDCAAFRMQRGTSQQDMSDADIGRLVIAREVCRNNAVEWSEVARVLAKLLDAAEKRADIVADGNMRCGKCGASSTCFNCRDSKRGEP